MIFGIVNIAVVLGLLIVTYLYMRRTKRLADDTKRMADMMIRDYELKVAPLIDVQFRSTLHSSQGFKIQFTLTNRGFYPVRAEKIILSWWYKKEPINACYIEKDLNVYLDKDHPISETIRLRDDELKKPEFPESMRLSGAHLGKIVSAGVSLRFYDMRGRSHRSIEKILDPIMN